MTREVLGWWLATRVGLFVLSVSAPLLFNRGTDYPDVWRAWVQWDVWHLKALAEFGYNNGEPSQAPLAAFFPGFPLLVHLVHFTGVGYVGAGIVVSAVASVVAGVYLARLAQYEFPELKGLGPNAAMVWYGAPVGVFLAAGYTEALFCAFAFPAWLAARQGRWARAAMFVALAATVRVSGIFLAFALVVEFVTSKKRDWPSAPWLALPAIPVLGFMAYLKQIHGSWFAWQEAQEKGWAREFTWPWDALIHTWDAASRGHFAGERSDWTWMFRAELVTLVIGLLLLGWAALAPLVGRGSLDRRHCRRLLYVVLDLLDDPGDAVVVAALDRPRRPRPPPSLARPVLPLRGDTTGRDLGGRLLHRPLDRLSSSPQDLRRSPA